MFYRERKIRQMALLPAKRISDPWSHTPTAKRQRQISPALNQLTKPVIDRPTRPIVTMDDPTATTWDLDNLDKLILGNKSKTLSKLQLVPNSMLWWHFFSIGPNLPRDPLMAHRWRTRRRKWLTCIQKRPCRIPKTGSTKEATKSKSRICKNIIHSARWTCSWP